LGGALRIVLGDRELLHPSATAVLEERALPICPSSSVVAVLFMTPLVMEAFLAPVSCFTAAIATT